MSLTSRTVSHDRADLGIRQLPVSRGLPRLPWLAQIHHVAFTNPFTDRAAGLRLLSHSVILVAAALGREVRRTHHQLRLHLAGPALTQVTVLASVP
jgi:hypothetical protein